MQHLPNRGLQRGLHRLRNHLARRDDSNNPAGEAGPQAAPGGTSASPPADALAETASLLSAVPAGGGGSTLLRDQRYFRCEAHAATLSVTQCRRNRRRIPPPLAQRLPYELPSWYVQPLACWSCALACQVEAGAVPFFTEAQVLAGEALAAGQAAAQAAHAQTPLPPRPAGVPERPGAAGPFTPGNPPEDSP